jgi:hypothetical protein
LEGIHPRIFIDQDPGYTQLWSEMHGPEHIVGRHDLYFTVGVNVGTDRSLLPTNGLRWEATWNPVVTDWWPLDAPLRRAHWTTVADWWGQPYLEFGGQVLGPKREEFMKFITVPAESRAKIELALDIPPDDADLAVLHAHGWDVSSPALVESVAEYRDWVSGSLGEFSCTKGVYVGTRSGWFSDRSAAYLACGRPVILQDTGFSDVLPTGEGLLTFRTIEEAVAAIEAVGADYRRHARAARQLAREYFDSSVVLPRLLHRSDVAGVRSGMAS